MGAKLRGAVTSFVSSATARTPLTVLVFDASRGGEEHSAALRGDRSKEDWLPLWIRRDGKVGRLSVSRGRQELAAQGERTSAAKDGANADKHSPWRVAIVFRVEGAETSAV
jgi:hypothetical protein